MEVLRVANNKTLEKLRAKLLVIANFPSPGVMFRDFTPLLADPELFQQMILQFANAVPKGTTKIVAIESRGFILGSALAFHLGLGLVLVRKSGKLPRATHRQDFQLEYGHATLEIQEGDLNPNDKVVIIDDVLATGGTAWAAGQLVRAVGAQTSLFLFLIQLLDLPGEMTLREQNIQVLLQI